MRQSFIINCKLPSLNEYINASRGNKYASAKMKKEFQAIIGCSIKNAKLQQVTKQCYVHFIWHENTKRRDKDNVAFAKKFILDSLQEIGILINDNNNYVLGFSDDFVYDKTQKVNVIIEEV